MRDCDVNSWLVQIANKEKESYQFGSELLYYTAAIDVSDGEGPLDEKGHPLDTGGTSIDCNASTLLILNEEKLNIAYLPGQPSVGCPILGTELHESEAELSVTSVTGGGAVSDSNSQLPSQHLAFTNTNILLEANSPGAEESNERIESACQCSPEVIDCELAALQTASQSEARSGF